MPTMRITELARAGAGILIDTPLVFEWDDRTHSMMQDSLDLELSVNTVRSMPAGAEEPVEHVMSTEWPPFEIHGEWLDKWAGQGFAWNTYVEFARMVGRAPLVRLELGKQSIVGILTNLKQRHRTEWEIAWQVKMSPHQNEAIGSARRAPASAPVTTSFSSRVDENEISFTTIQERYEALTSGTAISEASTDEIADAGDALDELRDAMDANSTAIESMTAQSDIDRDPVEFLEVARRKVFAVTASFRLVQDAATEAFESVKSLTSDIVLAYDDVIGMLTFEEWVRDTTQETLHIAAVAAAGMLDAKTRAEQRPRAIHRVRSGDSLERLSIKYYGTADNWAIIFDVNHLDSIILEPGAELIIPEPNR